jgi:hypothetical protein
MKMKMPTLLVDLAEDARRIINAAEAAGVSIDDGNVIDLVPDNTDASLSDIRDALIIGGLAPRFPHATRPRQLPS